MYLLYFSCKPAQAPVQKKDRLFFKKFSTPNSPNLFSNLPDLPADEAGFPNFLISPNKKTDISFSVAIIAEISVFDFMPKIGFLFFLFLVSLSQDKIYFTKIFYSTAKFFVKSHIFFAPTFLVIHSYFPAQPNISLNAPPRRSKMETFGAPV